MEYQKVIILLDNTTNQPSKFKTKNWVEINDELREACNDDDNNNKNKYDINPIQIGKRKHHFIRLNHVLFDLNKLSKDRIDAFIILFTPFYSVKLTASKNF